MKFTLCLLIILVAFSSAAAQKMDSRVVASARAEKAATILKQFVALGTDSVPFDIFRRAKAVAVFNNITDVSLLFSKMIKGKGVLSVRNSAANEWSTPVFLEFSGGGIDFKIASKKNFDIVFFVMDDKTVELFKKSGVKAGKLKGEKIALGPVVKGAGAEAVVQKASIIYYTFENGQLSGQYFHNDGFFNSVALTLDNDLNKIVYGKNAKQILTQNLNDTIAPSAAENFRQTIINNLVPVARQP